MCDISIYIRDAPATYPEKGIASLPGRALSKMGLKRGGPENLKNGLWQQGNPAIKNRIKVSFSDHNGITGS